MKSTESSFDIFLSYRREGGQATALLFKERLERAGYSVFYDKKSMHSGQWTEQIQDALKGCSDFLLVLNRGALDRCVSERALSAVESGDVMRRELAFALKEGRNIVPLILPEFKFPPSGELPADIWPLPSYQGVEVSISHFNETFSQLSTLLTAKPSVIRNLRTIRRGVAALLAIGVGAIAAFAGRWLYHGDFPSTRAETQRVNEMIALVSRQTTACESAAAAQLALIAKARRSVEVENPSVYETEVSFFRRSMLEARDVLDKAKPAEPQLSALRDTPVDVGVLRALFDMADAEMDGAVRTLPVHLEFLTRRDNPMSKADRLDCIERKRTYVELRSCLYALGVMELLLPIRREATEEFRKLVPTFVSIPRLSGEWPRDKETLEREQSSVLERMEASLRETVALVGNMNLDAAGDARTFESRLVSAGASAEKAAELSGKVGVLAAEKTELVDLEGRLAQKRDEAYRRFRPAATDEPDFLWGKVLRFRLLKRPEAVLEALELLRMKAAPDFQPGAIRSMETLVRLGEEAPFTNGVMVSSYEPPATNHAIFRPGDVIVERDAVSIRRFTDYKTQVGSRYVFWRLDDEDAFRRLEAVLPAGQPRVGFVEINEQED